MSSPGPTLKQSPLTIKSFCLGDWMTNCFVVHGGQSNGCWIVDAGFDPQPMIEYIRGRGLEPEQVVLTHAHVDHIAGLSDIRKQWPDLPIVIHPAEQEFLVKPSKNLSALLPVPIKAPAATGTIKQGDTLKLDDAVFEVRHTPGHSPGGITLYNAADTVALVGDALFAGSIGRTDFPTSNHQQLIEAIHRQLLTLPDETRVLSGHGPETTIGCERASNPFL